MSGYPIRENLLQQIASHRNKTGKEGFQMTMVIYVCVCVHMQMRVYVCVIIIMDTFAWLHKLDKIFETGFLQSGACPVDSLHLFPK